MIRSIRKTPLMRLSFQTFVLMVSLANTFAQTGTTVRNGRESALSALKQELLELERELVEYRMTEKEEPKSANSFPLILKTSKPNITPSNRDTNQAESIHSLRTDLNAIENGLTTFKGTETDNFPGVKPDTEVITVRRKQVVLKHKPSKYFLFVNPGIAFSQDREFKLSSGDKAILGTHNGLDLSIAFGRQFGSWSIGPEIGFRQIGYSNFILPSFSILENATGDSTSYSFALYGGRDFSITHFWKLHGGISLGVASRHETFTLPDFDDPRRRPAVPTPYQQTDDGPRFQGSIRLALEYEFSKLCSAHLGYRFSYVEDLRDFDSMPIHQAQIGMRFRL